MSRYSYEALDELYSELEDIIVKVEKPQEILIEGAKEFVKDLLKLPKPISNIKKSGYTHLIDTFYYDYGKHNDVEVGWGKYYGRMVEYGTVKTRTVAHMRPLFEKNKDKYYNVMLKKIF